MKKRLMLLCILCSITTKISTDYKDSSRAIYFSSSSLLNSTFVFNKSGRYAFSTDSTYNYTPTTVVASTPMIKIVASDVTIDFNDIGIYNTDNSSLGWTGIEIGWTPAELLADSTRVQPNNITIENLSLYNFDAGILIHAGVSSVSIKNCDFYDIALGVGVLGTSTELCQNLELNSVNFFGYGNNFHGALVNMKTLIETTYGYGANYFMPLKADPLNADSVDVYTYFGMWMNHLMIGSFDNLGIHRIGYSDYATTSEGNGLRSEGIGLRIQNSSRLIMNNVVTSEVFSEIKAVGLQLDAVKEIELHNCNFSYNSSLLKSVGIEAVNSTNLPYTVEALIFNNVVTKSNLASSGIAIGMDLTSVRGVRGSRVTSKYNVGDLQAYGLYTTKLYTIDIRDSSFSENTATRQVNDVATTQGIIAAGFYGVNVNSMQQTNVDFSSINALNTVYGLYLGNSSSCQFFDCRFVANVVTAMRSGEAAAIRSQQDSQEISKHAPCVTAATTGAYGVFLSGSKYLKFERCSANSNTGHRAMGFCVQNCRSVALWDCLASTQSATGMMLDSSFLTDNVGNPSSIAILPYHRPLLFGDLTKSSVDAVAATDLFLSKVTSVRAAQLAGTVPAYSDVKSLLATSSLLQAMIARYRLWGVAIGVQAHNVIGMLLKNCMTIGQVSLFDSAIGICFSGRNSGHSIEKCNSSFNVGSYYSALTQTTNPSALYVNSYNLLGFSLFWNTLLMNKTPWSLSTSASLGVGITAIAFNPSGSLLAIGSSDNNVRIYDTSTWTLTQTLAEHGAPITALAWKPDGTQLASSDTAGSNNIKIWDTTTWIIAQNLTQAAGGVYALSWKADGTLLASGSAGATDNIVIWDSSSWVAVQSLAHGSVQVSSLVWSPDGSRLVSGSSETTNNMKVWNTTSWTVVNTLSGHTDAVTSLSYNVAGTLLASGSADTTVKVWDTSAWTVSQTLSGSAGIVNAVKFKPDDKLLAVAYTSNVVKIWKTTSWGSLEETLSDFTGPVLCLDWNFNGRLLTTGSSDFSYRTYNTNIWKKAATTNDIGIYTGSSNFIAQDSLSFGSAINGNSVFIDLKGTQRNLVSPIGPVGAGIVMGDMMLEGVVQDSNLYSNMGNAGHGYGALLDKAFSITLESNLIAGNNSNAHGFVTGALDVTTHSPNLYMKNTLEGNKCSVFNNANYLIPFNPADPNGLVFPVQQFMNGKFPSVLSTGYDNSEIVYSQDATFYPFESLYTIPLDSSLRSYLTLEGCWS